MASFNAATQERTFNYKLVNKDNQAIQTAKIYIKVLGYKTETDSAGRFSFVAPDFDTMALSIEYNGEDYLVSVDASHNGQENKITLSGEPIERIIVNANLEKSLLKMAQPVIILEGDALLTKRGVNIAETLAREPGVSSAPFGPGAGRPVIRGLTGGRVTVLNNGIGTLDVSATSPDHAISSEPLIARQVEVLKGPATLIYGENAIGGVVNVVTDRIPTELPQAPFSGGAEIRFNSASREQAGVGQVLLNIDNLNIYADGYYRNSQNVNLPDSLGGTLFNSGISANGGAVGFAWVSQDSGSIGISISDSNNDYGLPTLNSGDEFVGLSIDQRRVDVSGEIYVPVTSIEKIKVKVANNDYEHVEIEDGEIGTRFKNDATEFRLEAFHNVWQSWRTVTGIQVIQRSYSAIGEEAFVPPSSTNSAGLFVIGERSFKTFDIELGMRFNQSKIGSDVLQNEKTFWTFSSSIRGLKELSDGHVVALSLSHAERPPSAEELLSDGPHLATQSFEIGNLDLNKETSTNVDISIRRSVNRFNYEFNAYLNEYKDFKYERPNGEFIEDLPVFHFTQQDARFSGVEFDFDWAFESSLPFDIKVNGMLDYVRGRLKQGGDLPRIPPLRLGLGVTVINNNFTINADVVRYMSQNMIAEFETTSPAYTSLNIDVNYSLFDGSNEWLFFVRGTNLLDSEIINHTSFIKNIAPEAGRSLNAGLRVNF